MSAQDVRESLGKIMAEIGSKEPLPEEKPSPSYSVEFDIFDEPAKTPPFPLVQPPAPETPPLSGKVAGATGTIPKTESDEKIISVDQISDLSGLILPKGATFKIEELKLHGRVNVFEGKGTGSLPQRSTRSGSVNFQIRVLRISILKGMSLQANHRRSLPLRSLGSRPSSKASDPTRSNIIPRSMVLWLTSRSSQSPG